MIERKINVFVPLAGRPAHSVDLLVKHLEEDGDFRTRAGYLESDGQENLEHSDVFIAVLDSQSIDRPDFQQLLTIARNSKIRILPIISDPLVEFSKIPDSIKSIQWTELWDNETLGKNLERIVAAIKTDYSYMKDYRHYSSAADDWFYSGERSELLMRGSAMGRAQSWLIQSEMKFPVPSERMHRFILRSADHAVSIRKRNERIAQVFWSVMGMGALCCMILAALIFSDVLVIRSSTAEAVLRKQQSQDLIQFMVGDLDEQLTKMEEMEVLEGIVQKAESYLDEMGDVALGPEEVQFVEKLELQIVEAKGHLESAQEE